MSLFSNSLQPRAVNDVPLSGEVCRNMVIEDLLTQVLHVPGSKSELLNSILTKLFEDIPFRDTF